MKLKNTLNWLLITISAMIFTACGGGGSGDSQLPSASVQIVDEKQSYSAGEVIYFTTSTVLDTNVTVTYGNGQTLKSILTDDGSYVTMLPVDLSDGTQSLTFDLGENNDTINLLLQSTPFTANPYEYNLAILTKLRDELIIESATLAGDELAFIETQITELEDRILELESLSDEDQFALAKILSLYGNPAVAPQTKSFKTTSLLNPLAPSYAISGDACLEHFIGLPVEVAKSAYFAGVIAVGLSSGATGIAIPIAGIVVGYTAVLWSNHTRAALAHAANLTICAYEYTTGNDADISFSPKVSSEMPSLQRSESISGTTTFNDGIAKTLSIKATMALSEEIKSLINKLKSIASTIDRILPDSLVPSFVITIKNLNTADKEVTLKPSQLSIVSVTDSRIMGNITGTDVSQFTFTAGENVTEETNFSFTVKGMNEAGTTVVYSETINATFIPSIACGSPSYLDACVYYEYYLNGNIFREIPFLNGVKEGILKEYYESGILALELPYINDIVHGTQKKYYESGSLYLTLDYVNGTKNGWEHWYYDQPNILHYKHPVVDGLKHGIETTYCYPSGTVEATRLYEYGVFVENISWIGCQ